MALDFVVLLLLCGVALDFVVLLLLDFVVQLLHVQLDLPVHVAWELLLLHVGQLQSDLPVQMLPPQSGFVAHVLPALSTGHARPV